MGEKALVGRDLRIDLMKGVGILCVLLIHAGPFAGSAVHDYLINRAVPVLLFLFGASSEHWWSGRSNKTWIAITREWFRMRLPRLMLPVWGMLVVWWTLVLCVDFTNGAVPPAPFRLHIILATFLGYQPWVATGWFVTLVVQMVIFFPFLALAIRYVGFTTVLLISVVACVASYIMLWQVIDFMRELLLDSAPGAGRFYRWIFVPSHLATVVCGVGFVRRGSPCSVRLTLTWIGLFMLGLVLVGYVVDEPLQRAAIQALMDVPLALLLVSSALSIVPWEDLRTFLVWCGRNSWGIYLGQLLVFSAIGMTGYHGALRASVELRWVYCLLLFAGGCLFVELQRRLSSAVVWVRQSSQGRTAAR